MKAVLLAGGFGTRISEESQFKPKPMIEIGGMPILWHIMKLYSYYGINEFIICAGYKQHVIKEWFADYFLHTSDITFDFTQDDKIKNCIVFRQKMLYNKICFTIIMRKQRLLSVTCCLWQE